MPFGAGARHCVGRHLAEFLCTRFLSTVLRDFELVPLHDVAVSFSATVSVSPSSVPVRLVPRPFRAGTAQIHSAHAAQQKRGHDPAQVPACPVDLAV
jgi:hypothetical protein